MRYKVELESGQLAIIKIADGLTVSEDGFSMGGLHNNKDKMIVYEKIDLDNFPSFKDFKGKKTVIRHDEIVLILRFVGRPISINRDPDWFKYDVYEILTKNGSKCQMFKQNLYCIETEIKK